MAITWKKVAYEADVITKAILTATGDILYASAASTPAALAGAPAAHHLNDHTAADGAVDFNLQVATDLVVHTVANEAALPAGAGTVALGQPCWCTAELSLHVCTAAA
jgi:hypothetical protein